MDNVSVSINYEEVAKKMYELYVVKDYPCIRQYNSGQYKWEYKIGSLSYNNYKVLVNHLQRKQTIGIMCHTHTKFICFDVDFKDDKLLSRWYTHKIVNTLEEFGFNNQYINVSLSGSKGFHVEIFFDEVVSYKQIEYLYDLVMEEIYYTIDYNSLSIEKVHNMTLDQLKGKIELRPRASLGLKLPLSIHQVTKNVCYYCDNITLEPIKDIKYIYEIKQCFREQIEDSINIGNELRASRNKINHFNNDVKEKVKPTLSQKLYVSEEYTIEYIEELITNGLQIEGSRHNSLMKIARYYYQFGYTREDNESLLVDWMKQQNNKHYKASEVEWRNDIKSILEFVYSKCRGLTGAVRDVTINKNEMMEILKHSARKKKILFYALIIHSKRYSIKNGEFYMTLNQITESTGLARHTILKYIEGLESDGEIKFVRKGKRRSNSFKNLPNKYIIINENIRCNNTDDKQYKIDKEVKDFEESFNKNVVYLFEKKEVQTILPYKQYLDFIKLYA